MVPHGQSVALTAPEAFRFSFPSGPRASPARRGPGTMKQQRLLATCARPVTEEDIAGIFARSIENW